MVRHVQVLFDTCTTRLSTLLFHMPSGGAMEKHSDTAPAIATGQQQACPTGIPVERDGCNNPTRL
jgi:hypothetical protein